MGSMLVKATIDLPSVKWVGAGLSAVVGYLLPDDSMKSAAVCAFCFVVLDTVTGVVAVATERLEEGEKRDPINSASFGRCVVKLIAYGAGIIVTSEVARHVGGSARLHSGAVTGGLSFCILTESLSIIENIRRMGISFPSDELNNLLDERLAKSRQKRKDRKKTKEEEN